jgi:Zn-dependent peptidase ImmA (M78 family)
LLEFHAFPVSRARNIISDWGIEDPQEIDLNAIAAEHGVLILEKPIHGAAARLISESGTGVVVVDQDIKEWGKKRFAAAHEFGHFVLHRNKTPVKVCTDDSFFEWYSKSEIEPESNAFAAELLMPESMFTARCKCRVPGFSIVEKLAEDFETTLTATAIRFTQFTNQACALIASKNSKVKWFFLNELFPYRVIGVGSKVHPYSYAHDFFESGNIPRGLEHVLGVAWLEDVKIGEKCLLYEDARALGSYGIVLSLIWIDEDENKRGEKKKTEHGLDPDYFTPDGKRYRW